MKYFWAKDFSPLQFRPQLSSSYGNSLTKCLTVSYDNLTYFLTVIRIHPDFVDHESFSGESGTVNGTINGTVNETQKRILAAIKADKKMTYDQLAEMLKKGRTTIYRNIKTMEEANLIKRIGSAKSGNWQVNR